MQVFTIGYGGRTCEQLTTMLRESGVRTVVDVRLRPDRASMGVWTKAKDPSKGIERCFADAGIGYRSWIQLGNVFLGFDDWATPYRALLERAGDLLVAGLDAVPGPICLLCAEKRVDDCHRSVLADYLAATMHATVVHLV